MSRYPVHACTDITGFGLIGHLAEMIEKTGLGIRLASEMIPIIPVALEYARMGLVPGGTYNNRTFRISMTKFGSSVDRFAQDLFFDPQTSGGLLICVDRGKADALLNDLKGKGIEKAAVIGEVISAPKEKIIVE